MRRRRRRALQIHITTLCVCVRLYQSASSLCGAVWWCVVVCSIRIINIYSIWCLFAKNCHFIYRVDGKQVQVSAANANVKIHLSRL